MSEKSTTGWLVKWQILVNLLFFALLALFSRFCCNPQPAYNSPCKHKENATLIQTDTRYVKGDSFPYKIYVKIAPVPVAVDSVKTPVNVDTNKIIPDYYAQKHFRDSVQNDTSYFLKYNLWISRNAVDSIKFDLQNLRKTAIITNSYEVKKPSRKIYFGGFAGGNVSRAAIGPGIKYSDKKETLYGYQYDAISEMHLVSLYRPVFKF